MAKIYKTPGVYIQETSNSALSIAEVETAIPVFIGYTQKSDKDAPGDLLRIAVRITSMLQYESLFGGPPTQSFHVTLVDTPQSDGSTLTKPQTATLENESPFKMYHSMQVFFANGGGACYIISVGNYEETITLNLMDATETASIVGGLAIAKSVDEITLYVFPDAAALTPVDYYSLYESSLNECARLQDRFTIVDVKMNDALAPTQGNPVDHLQINANLGNNLKYGAAYYPWLKSILTYNFGVDYDKTSVTFLNSAGTLDGATWADSETENIVNDLFVNHLKSIIGKLKIDLPPSPFMAGIYARVDSQRGVWKAPANVNVSAAIKPLVNISNAEQERLNVDARSGRSVNAIRSFPGKGTLVWGARTLAGNDNEWRYISVRRFFNMVEESIKKSTTQFVFEPNDANTWVKVRTMIENFLTNQWRVGALVGSTPKESFFVRVGLSETMTAQDILEGRMIIEIGMAVVRPAEFIILKFSQKMQKS